MSVESVTTDLAPPPASTSAPTDWRRALRADATIGLAAYRHSERMLTRGQMLYAQGASGDYAYVLLGGWMAFEHELPTGSSQITDFALPGALLGHQRNADRAFTVGARCVTDCWIVVFQRRRLMDFVRANDGLYALYEATLAEDAARAQRRLANITQRRGPEKLADLIVELVDRAAATRVDENPAVLPVSQLQLAAALGLTNVYVSRVAKTLSEQGLIDWRKRRLEVLDLEALRELARVG